MDYSAGYPTDYPHGLPYGLPPRTTLNKQTNLRLRGKETQEAYLLQLHDHNCMKSSRHFLFTDFLCPIFFPFSPHFFISYQPKRNAVSIGKHRWISVSLGTVYTDAVSFVTTSVSMRLRLSLTRRWSSSLSESGRFEYAFKRRAFSKDTVSRSCKRWNRIDLKTVLTEIGWLAE